MPKVKIQKVKVPTHLQSSDAFINWNKEKTDQVDVLTNKASVIKIKDKRISLAAFVMYVHSIVEKAKTILSTEEMEVFSIFVNILQDNMIVVAKNIAEEIEALHKTSSDSDAED